MNGQGLVRLDVIYCCLQARKYYSPVKHRQPITLTFTQIKLFTNFKKSLYLLLFLNPEIA